MTLIDMTPLVNVIFLILIFFMITSDTLPLKSLLIEHPELIQHDEETLSQLVVIMDRDLVVYVGSKREISDFVSLPNTVQRHIEAWKRAHHGTAPIISIIVDKHVDYESFLKLFCVISGQTQQIRLSFRTPREAEERGA